MSVDLMFLQNGDFREAFERFASGGEETYLDQRKSVAFVEGLSRSLDVSVVSASDSDYDVKLASGLRAIGIARASFYRKGRGSEILEMLRPAMAIPRTAHPDFLWHLKRSRTPCYPLFADIFRSVSVSQMATREGLGRLRRNLWLRRQLSGQHIVAVGNHGFNAAQSLSTVVRLPRDRVTPWEWTRLKADPAPRSRGDGPATVLFTGVVSKDKGTGDLVEAIRGLRASGVAVRCVVVGAGPDLERLTARVDAEGLGEVVRFVGRVAHKQVGEWMRRCDIAVVPSRASYPEGMPNVIFEALAARLPLVLSDHPSFVGRLADGHEAVVFRGGDAHSLASAIGRVAGDGTLYRKLSQNAATALDRLYVGQSWYDLVGQFLNDPQNTTGWVARHSLAALAHGQEAA